MELRSPQGEVEIDHESIDTDEQDAREDEFNDEGESSDVALS